MEKRWYNSGMMKTADLIEQYKTLIQGEKKEKFDLFRALLLEYNEKYNLTTILEEKDMFYKHFLDSVLGERFFKKNALVAEIGSGAGFPSIPLKIIRDDLSFTLLESVGKKCDFLQVIVDKLQLSNVHIYNIRAEDAAKDKKWRETFGTAWALPCIRKSVLYLKVKGFRAQVSERKF